MEELPREEIWCTVDRNLNKQYEHMPAVCVWSPLEDYKTVLSTHITTLSTIRCWAHQAQHRTPYAPPHWILW